MEITIGGAGQEQQKKEGKDFNGSESRQQVCWRKSNSKVENCFQTL